MGLLNWWDRSIFNRAIKHPELLYHGTTLAYYNRERPKNYYGHIDSGGVWYEKTVKKAVFWAVQFATEFKDDPVLVIVNARKLKTLRRNWLTFHKGGWRPPYLRSNHFKKKYAVMIKLEFDSAWERDWNHITKSCKKDIASAELKVGLM